MQLFEGRNQRSRADQTGQLVHCEKNFLHLVFRSHVGAFSVSVGNDGVDDAFVDTGFLQQLGRFFAVLFRPHFEIDIVKYSADFPEIGVFSVTQFFGQIFHDTADGDAVMDVERILVVFFQKRESFFPIDIFITPCP